MDQEKKRVRRPSPSQMRAAAETLDEYGHGDIDDLYREAVFGVAAWLRQEAAK